MRRIEIEHWALTVIDIVQRGETVEDVRVELKADWPEPVKTARRVAGHANAIAGEDILWLIGVDEAKSLVTGASPMELANWWPQVESQFDSIAPAFVPVNIPIDGKIVVALLFETD